MTGALSRLLAWRRTLAWRAFPGICVLCDQASGRPRDLCDDCHTALPWLDQVCPRCGLPLGSGTPLKKGSGTSPTPGGVRDVPDPGGDVPDPFPEDVPDPFDICTACRVSPPPYQRCIAPLRYATPVAEMIRRIKFANSRVEARVLGSILGEYVVQRDVAAAVDLIVPVPLGRGRLLRRGHNQAALLAHWVGRASGLPVDCRLCRRTRATRAQSGLSRRARRVNLRGAFTVDARLDGARIAIVDDVVTTGATVAALARAMLRAGAATIDVWAVARTLEREPGAGSGF